MNKFNSYDERRACRYGICNDKREMQISRWKLDMLCRNMTHQRLYSPLASR